MIALGGHSATKRFAWFLGGLIIVLGILELFERRYSTLFAAATHRGLTKAAMFDRHPRVTLLFLGSSRTQDGVSPDLVTRALARMAPELGELPGFNAAFTGSSLDALITLAPRFEVRGDVRVAVIELSDPQVFNEAAPLVESDAPPTTLEGRLARGVQHVAFIRYRKALIGANLGRLPSLLAAASLGGWETKGTEQFASWIGRHEPEATGFDPARWHVEVMQPGVAVTVLDGTADTAVNRLAELATRYRSHGMIPVFAVPPLAVSERDAPERQAYRALFTELARRGACEVWNFAPLELPDSYFRDVSHLNREGRAQYSEALAHEIARVLKAGPPAAGPR